MIRKTDSFWVLFELVFVSTERVGHALAFIADPIGLQAQVTHIGATFA
jgi:hypothetical protein